MTAEHFARTAKPIARPVAIFAWHRESVKSGARNKLVKTRRTQISPGLRAPRTNGRARPGKRGMDVSRWFSSYRAKGERTPGSGGMTETRRIGTGWEGVDGGKVPANVLEMSQKERTPTSVGTARALSVSHSKFSFPTSVSTVPLLSHPPPALPAPRGGGAAARPVHRFSFNPPPPFQRFRGNRAGARSCGADAAATSERSRSERFRRGWIARARARARSLPR